MENKSLLKLPKKFEDYLEKLPEHGMGFQIVEIELTNGHILKERIILNSTYLKLNDGENLIITQIKEIKLKQK